MAWNTVVKGYRRPIGWWYHKILCDLGWRISQKLYYKHLHIMNRQYGINLYGQRFHHRPK
ncbi:hypothetical protein [Spirosoma harenae]